LQIKNEQTEPASHQSNRAEAKRGIYKTVAALVILMMLIMAGFTWSVYREAQRLKAEDNKPVAAESSIDQTRTQ
jgi:hypothetical protein